MTRLFDTGNIIECVVDEVDLLSLMLKLDIDDQGNWVYPDKGIVDVIFNALPEYVFAHHEEINNINALVKIREAAKALYNVDSFKAINKYYIENDATYKEEAEKHTAYKRGEFGEILLHVLLRDFKGTVPLISKVYFKDSSGVPAHGFDAVHYSPDDKILWLGESKLYTDGKRGIDDLINDLKEHFTHDFMQEQYTIIKKNVENSTIQERDYWVGRFSRNVRLQDMISNVNIPLLCVYPDDAYKQSLEGAITDIAKVIETNSRDLKQCFDKKNDAPLKNNLNIILFLFPVRDKHEFVINLHTKLHLLQNI